MSHEWLDIQSFFADQDILTAINDLAIALKLEAAGVSDPERIERAELAREILRKFLSQLDEERNDVAAGVDPRFQELSNAFASARRDTTNFKSVLVQMGASETIPLLDAHDARRRRALLQSLEELRRIITRHQQADVSAIFEDF